MDIFFGIAFVVSFAGLLLAFISAKKVHARLLALHAENERLQKAMRKYGRHFDECEWYFDEPCNCGFAAIAAGGG